eukprot:scaffold93045_cov16-Tisochrysis_lutea.AAC.2
MLATETQERQACGILLPEGRYVGSLSLSSMLIRANDFTRRVRAWQPNKQVLVVIHDIFTPPGKVTVSYKPCHERQACRKALTLHFLL